ncbi:histidine phosphatase family protein [Paenibacillus sp. CAU 1782]
MYTYIYMVRHGESPKAEGNERTRGLTEKGAADAKRITSLLQREGIDAFYSSPYLRAVQTVEDLAGSLSCEVELVEELKEIVFLSDDKIMPDHELYPLVNKMFINRELSSPGEESVVDCQRRSVAVLEEILKKNNGQKVAIGTHGAVMTLMMEHFDPQYGFEFLMKTSKPDVYKMTFEGEKLLHVDRLWEK